MIMSRKINGTMPDSLSFDREKVLQIMSNKKVALFIVAYNAENHIRRTIERVPKEIANRFAQIYLIDDFSKDRTFEAAEAAFKEFGIQNYKVMRTPFNQGYGGNQKIGYTYAIKNGYDYVIMLHGDGQYPPEFLPHIIEGYANPEVAAVFGSRMLVRYEALKGGMPIYKWLGNMVLTFIENKILGTRLSEFHSGYRSYAVSALKTLPFALNSNNFHFDTDIIIQFIANDYKIKEIPMPTHYGDEVCHVNGLKYFWNCLKSVIKFRLHKLGIFYQPNFDIESPLKREYRFKSSPNTLHQRILSAAWEKGDSVVDLGANDGLLAAKIAPMVGTMTAVDINGPEPAPGVKALQLDLNSDFTEALGREAYDKVIALDVIEHLNEPEKAMLKIGGILKDGGRLYISTANVAFFIVRMALLFGWFNYGKKGILDKTHHRLFTVSSFLRLLKNSGFKVEDVIGFGPPIADEISNKGIFAAGDKIAGFLAGVKPSLFSFNFLVVATKKPSLKSVYDLTTRS